MLRSPLGGSFRSCHPRRAATNSGCGSGGLLWRALSPSQKLPATRIDVEARAAAGANWTSSATAELAKLKIKHDDRKAVAFEDGHLLAKEVTDDVGARLEDIQAKRNDRDRAHATAERRQFVQDSLSRPLRLLP